MARQKFKIEATKGMAATVGVCCVKENGKIVRYFGEWSEASTFVQQQIEADRCIEQESH